MKYRNDDPQAVIAMELERTGGYGEYFGNADGCSGSYDDCGSSCYDTFEEKTDTCPICGAVSPEHFFMNDDEECVGCYECVHRVYELF